jgi:hypothetical protein
MKSLLHVWLSTTCQVVENERDNNLEPLFDQAFNVEQWRHGLTFQTFMEGTKELKNSQTHFNFKNNLIECLWVMNGFN